MQISVPACCLALFLSLTSAPVTPAQALKPYGTVPSAAQLDWHDLEFLAFVHFNMSTFAETEWSSGREHPNQFQPTDLDCRQWCRLFKETGMKGVIITAKHHDGFCLWPSETTEHDVASSSWRDGKGDVLKELKEACDEFGLKLGLYLSPWDQSTPLYGEGKAYNDYFVTQLEELLTLYPDTFEMWFDGASRPGRNGKRQVYDWKRYYETIRKLAPQALIFSEIGPDIRWCGNERGYAGERNLCTLNLNGLYMGMRDRKHLQTGHLNGTHWVPSECDVSIRKGWFYHGRFNHQIKSDQQLHGIYHASVGRGATLLLNVPPDKTGQIADREAQALRTLGERLATEYQTNLLTPDRVTVSASSHLNPERYPVSHLLAPERSYWAAATNDLQASIEFSFHKPTAIDRIVLQEGIEFGQRIGQTKVEGFSGETWQTLAGLSCIGHKQILQIPTCVVEKLRITCVQPQANPVLRHIAAYRIPAPTKNSDVKE